MRTEPIPRAKLCRLELAVASPPLPPPPPPPPFLHVLSPLRGSICPCIYTDSTHQLIHLGSYVHATFSIGERSSRTLAINFLDSASRILSKIVKAMSICCKFWAKWDKFLMKNNYELRTVRKPCLYLESSSAAPERFFPS